MSGQWGVLRGIEWRESPLRTHARRRTHARPHAQAGYYCPTLASRVACHNLCFNSTGQRVPNSTCGEDDDGFQAAFCLAGSPGPGLCPEGNFCPSADLAEPCEGCVSTPCTEANPPSGMYCPEGTKTEQPCPAWAVNRTSVELRGRSGQKVQWTPCAYSCQRTCCCCDMPGRILLYIAHKHR